MEDTSAGSALAPAGYRSDSGKRRFTLTTGLLGAAFLIAQFALPMALMMGLMATEGGVFRDDSMRVDPQRAGVMGNNLYYIARPLFERESEPAALLSIDVDMTSTPQEVASLPRSDMSVLAGPDLLWLITKTETFEFAAGEIRAVPAGIELAEFTQPFLYLGRPAALERWPTGLVLVTHNGDGWRRGPELPLAMPDESCQCGFGWAKAIADGPIVHVFVELGSTLYHAPWVPTEVGDVNWQLVGDAGDSWWPIRMETALAVFSRMPDEGGGEVIGIRLGSAGWERFSTGESVRYGEIAAFSHPDPDKLLVLAGFSFGGDIMVMMLEGSHVTGKWLLGKDVGEPEPSRASTFDRGIYTVMAVQYSFFLLLPLVLAVVLSALMRRHRTPTIDVNGRRARHASLTRRAVAQLIDALVLVAPIGAGVYVVQSSAWPLEMDRAEGIWETVAAALPVLVGGVLFLVGFALLAYSEGKWGITPGKWVGGIRVMGVDLEPCGFSRALVRNILKVIDGFFNFTVGIMVVALSENWQRVGDMAARTVVVDARSRSSHGGAWKGG